MRCEEVRSSLPLLEDAGERSAPVVRADILAHLSACDNCTAYRAQMNRVSALVRGSGTLPISEAALDRVAAGVMACLADEGRHRWAFRVAAWWRSVERSPVPRLLEAAVIVWAAILLVLQLPGVGPALRTLMEL